VADTRITLNDDAAIPLKTKSMVQTKKEEVEDDDDDGEEEEVSEK